MKSILFIETPLHLVNALEAIHYFKLTDYQFFIRYSNQSKNDSQINSLIDKLLSENEKKSVFRVTINGGKKKLLDLIKILYFKIYFNYFIKHYKYIFIGDYSSGFFSLILKNFDRKKVILLDDGAKTITIQNQFDQDNFFDLFTIYSLKPKFGQKIFENNFIVLQSKLKKNLVYDKNMIMFLGSKLNEEGIISEQYYLSLITEIAKRYKKYKILYIPHRGECEKKLKKISLIDNINIKSCNYPIEFYGIYENSIPKQIFSFYSTALWSMARMYSEVEVIAFKFNYSNSIHKGNINSIYNYLSRYIKIIDLTIKHEATMNE